MRATKASIRRCRSFPGPKYRQLRTKSDSTPTHARCLSNVFVHSHCLQCAALGCEQAGLRGPRNKHGAHVGRATGATVKEEPQIPNERPRILLVVAGEYRKFGCQIFTALNNTFSSGVARRTAARAMACSAAASPASSASRVPSSTWWPSLVKGRGICPSCLGRKMRQTALNLTEHVLPAVPLRQWVLTVAHPLRARLAYDGPLLGAVTRLFVDSILGWYQRYCAPARASSRRARCRRRLKLPTRTVGSTEGVLSAETPACSSCTQERCGPF
jgi:hypothetical protein